MDFENYKEKQKYYKERAKQSKLFWDSTGTINKGTKKKPHFNGRTYVKPKEIKSGVIGS